MHIMIMHNSMLLDFSVVLTRITLLFPELGVLPQTLEPRRVERPFLPQASSFLHILIELFYKNYFQKRIIIIALKKKNYFWMMWIAIYIYCLAGNRTADWCCGGGSIVRESIYLGLITNVTVILTCRIDAFTMRSAMDGKSQPYLLSFTYPRQAITWLCPLRRPTAWKRVTFPPDGVTGIEAREWCGIAVFVTGRATNGRICVVRRGAVIGLDSYLAPYHGSMDGKDRPERQQGWVSLMGKVTQVCRVNNKKLRLSHPCSRKELQTAAGKASQVMTMNPWRLWA